MSPAETVESIAGYLGRFADLPVADIERWVAKGRGRVLEPGDNFCRLGQQTHEVGSIQTGIVRYFVTLPDGNESTKDSSASCDCGGRSRRAAGPAVSSAA